MIFKNKERGESKIQKPYICLALCRLREFTIWFRKNDGGQITTERKKKTGSSLMHPPKSFVVIHSRDDEWKKGKILEEDFFVCWFRYKWSRLIQIYGNCIQKNCVMVVYGRRCDFNCVKEHSRDINLCRGWNATVNKRKMRPLDARTHNQLSMSNSIYSDVIYSTWYCFLLEFKFEIFSSSLPLL